MPLELDVHRWLLGDDVRLRAFAAALRDVVRPDHVVLDLGAGSGVLGLLACRAGARHVYSVEQGAVIDVARGIARANGVADRITFVLGRSTDVDLPAPADVVVADQMIGFGFGAGALEFFADARERLLKPGAVAIPSRIALHAAAVESPKLHERLAFWRSRPLDIDLRPFLQPALNQPHPTTLEAGNLLGPSVGLGSIDLAWPQSEGRLRFEAILCVERPGTLHGIGGWFHATLSPGVEITNAPLQPGRLDREPAVLPIATPVEVSAGDRIDLTLDVVAPETVIAWKGVVHAGGRRVAFNQSTWQSIPLAGEDVRRSQPDFRPRLSPRAAARRTVLDLCDGSRTRDQICDEVGRNHADLFPSRSAVERFVAETLRE